MIQDMNEHKEFTMFCGDCLQEMQWSDKKNIYICKVCSYSY